MKPKVFVINVQGEPLTRPATVIVGPGEEVVAFRNLTNDKAIFLFPSGVFEKDTLELEAGRSASLKMTAGAGAGAYPYTVVVPAHARIAVGHSSPIIIRDP
jgi:hypothetical protein